MPTILRWRLIAALLLATATALPALSLDPLAAVAQEGGDDGDDNSGHGNDDDREDNDNPGRSSGQDGQPGEAGESVTTAGGYTVDIACDIDDDSTECDVEAIAPPGASEVVRVIVPDALVCAAVVDGDGERVASDVDERLTGYASDEGDDEVSLELAGMVAPAGTATYWVISADGVFPATGPALLCEPAAGLAGASTTATVAAESPAPTPTPTPAPTTGTLLVAVSTCADVPADTAGFDWFGRCQPGGATQTFALSGGPGDVSHTVETDGAGEARFADLGPGTYDLDLVDGSWCHAKADNVTADSGVVIEAGVSTTVWIFLCEAKTGT